jgi:outer membrane protein W
MLRYFLRRMKPRPTTTDRKRGIPRMKKSITTILGILALASAGAASAQKLTMSPYIGATGGFAAWDANCAGTTDCKKNPGSVRVFGGVNLSPNTAVELTYASLGTLKATVSGTAVGIKGSSMDVSAVYRLGNTQGGLGFFVKGGLAYTNAKATALTYSATEKGWGLVLGAGVTYALTPSVGLRAEIDTQNVKVPGTSGNVTSLTVGGQASF